MGEKVKHTPGPWRFTVESVNDEWGIVIDASGGIIANVNSETGPDATSAPAMRQMPMRANGALLAAAPDLLAALKWIADHGDAGAGGRPAYHDMRAKARAAIAKAEGGAS
jgi:hypothetical protein